MKHSFILFTTLQVAGYQKAVEKNITYFFLQRQPLVAGLVLIQRIKTYPLIASNLQGCFATKSLIKFHKVKFNKTCKLITLLIPQ
jgi:hypothetical protein